MSGVCQVHPKHVGIAECVFCQMPNYEGLLEQIAELQAERDEWRNKCEALDALLNQASSEPHVVNNYSNPLAEHHHAGQCTECREWVWRQIAKAADSQPESDR